jgi:4-hydroxy-tetrahydrodipicolinate synthase
MTPDRDLFSGSLVAIVTPFKDGEVDHDAVRTLVVRQVEGGTNAIVVSGTTGESPTLSEAERLKLLETVLQAAEGRCGVIAGTGSNNTAHVIESSRAAEKAGADGLLVVTPYYNKPTQAGLLAHYHAVADAVSIPLILYSVPGRTGVAIAPETVAALASHENVGALKEAGGSVDRVSEIRQVTDLPILSGDDPLTLPMMAVGARGVVSVTANVAPAPVAEMTAAVAAGEWSRALSLHERLYPLHRAMFLSTNPLPVKESLALMGLIEREFRLPLTPMDEDGRARLRAVLAAFDLVS